MKVYKTNMVILRVPSCQECPNRKAQAYKNGEKFSTEIVCGAIEREGRNYSGEVVTKHPPIRDARFYGGLYLPDCPLEEEEGQDEVTQESEPLTTLYGEKELLYICGQCYQERECEDCCFLCQDMCDKNILCHVLDLIVREHSPFGRDRQFIMSRVKKRQDFWQLIRSLRAKTENGALASAHTSGDNV